MSPTSLGGKIPAWWGPWGHQDWEAVWAPEGPQETRALSQTPNTRPRGLYQAFVGSDPSHRRASQTWCPGDQAERPPWAGSAPGPSVNSSLKWGHDPLQWGRLRCSGRQWQLEAQAWPEWVTGGITAVGLRRWGFRMGRKLPEICC